ncbi:MAG: ribulose-phosphate 3-epimerase [Ferrimicrobium sp.]
MKDRSMPHLQIAPSILPADFSRLGDELSALAYDGVDRIHWDVMDGVFVPNLTVGAGVIASCRGVIDLPFEAHLMIVEPDSSIPSYVAAGCELVTIHAEATRHLHRTLSLIHDQGARAGVALNPATSITAIEHVMDLVDVVLIMTVNPGFGGQSYLSSIEPKIAAAAQLRDLTNPNALIEVDGGIGIDTLAGALKHGAEVVVSGSALFNYPQGRSQAVSTFRQIAKEAFL